MDAILTHEYNCVVSQVKFTLVKVEKETPIIDLTCSFDDEVKACGRDEYCWKNGGFSMVQWQNGQYYRKWYLFCYNWEQGCRARKSLFLAPGGTQILHENEHNHSP